MTNVLRFVAFRIKRFFTVSLCLTNCLCCNDLLALSQCSNALRKLLRSLDDPHSSDSAQIAVYCKIATQNEIRLGVRSSEGNMARL